MGKGRMWLACFIVGITVFFLGLFSSPKLMSVMCFGGAIFFTTLALYLGQRHVYGGWIILSWLLCGLGVIGIFIYLLMGK